MAMVLWVLDAPMRTATASTRKGDHLPNSKAVHVQVRCKTVHLQVRGLRPCSAPWSASLTKVRVSLFPCTLRVHAAFWMMSLHLYQTITTYYYTTT